MEIRRRGSSFTEIIGKVVREASVVGRVGWAWAWVGGGGDLNAVAVFKTCGRQPGLARGRAE